MTKAEAILLVKDLKKTFDPDVRAVDGGMRVTADALQNLLRLREQRRRRILQIRIIREQR